MKKNVTTVSGMVVRNFFTFYVWADRTPTGGKSQNMGLFSHFGLGRPLAIGEILGPGRNRKKKTQSPGARGPKTEKKITTLSGMVVRNFFTFYGWADRTPRGGKSRNTGCYCPR